MHLATRPAIRSLPCLAVLTRQLLAGRSEPVRVDSLHTECDSGHTELVQREILLHIQLGQLPGWTDVWSLYTGQSDEIYLRPSDFHSIIRRYSNNTWYSTAQSPIVLPLGQRNIAYYPLLSRCRRELQTIRISVHST